MAPRSKAVASSATGSLPRFLTAAETAELLRTSRKAVYALAERGHLSGVVRIGRRMLVRSDVLLDRLDQRQVRSPKGGER